MGHHFTSLQTSIEKLLEAEYFLGLAIGSHGDELRYNLNAFLSASRSVTFYLQKSMSKVSGFKSWYSEHQSNMRADPVMGFFLELRNISQHEGPVSIVGGSTSNLQRWTYRFAGNRVAVPEALTGTSVARACADQLVRLAQLVNEFWRQFPHDSCIHQALTLEGVKRLEFTLDDVAALLGLPSDFLDVGAGIPLEEKLRVLRREFDPIDSTSLRRLSEGQLFFAGAPLIVEGSSGQDLTDDIAALVESGQIRSDPRAIFLHTILRRINEQENRAIEE